MTQHTTQRDATRRGADLEASSRRTRSWRPSRTGSRWRVPLALIMLTTFPVVAGTLRLIEIAGGPHLMPANLRIAASPMPLIVHVVSAAVFAVLGAFQFPRRLRREHPGWHRRAGRVLAVAGLLVGGSGLWMTLFYSGAPGGAILWSVRLVVGTAMAASVILGVIAIRRRDLPAHRGWMTRAYALSLGAGTQMFTQGIGEAVFGITEMSTGLSVSAGWVVNAALAELIIRQPWLRRRRSLVASPV